MFLIYFILFLYLMMILFSWIQYQIKLSRGKQAGAKEEVKKKEFPKEPEEIEEQKFEEAPISNLSQQDRELDMDIEIPELFKEGEADNLFEPPREKKLEKIILLQGEDTVFAGKEELLSWDIVRGIIFSEIIGLPRAKKIYKYKR